MVQNECVTIHSNHFFVNELRNGSKSVPLDYWRTKRRKNRRQKRKRNHRTLPFLLNPPLTVRTPGTWSHLKPTKNYEKSFWIQFLNHVTSKLENTTTVFRNVGNIPFMLRNRKITGRPLLESFGSSSLLLLAILWHTTIYLTKQSTFFLHDTT